MSRYGSLASVSLIGGIVSILFPIVALFGSVAVVVSSGLSVTLALREKCSHKVERSAVGIAEEQM